MKKCAACGEPMTVIFDGQRLHPCCHPCQRPVAGCTECVAERRAHRRTVAKLRAQAFAERTSR